MSIIWCKNSYNVISFSKYFCLSTYSLHHFYWLTNCQSKCCLLVLPDKIQSISAPYFLRGCCGDWSELVRPPLLRDFSELFLAPLPYCRIADAGICRLYSTSPSWVILGSWRRERRAYKTLNVVRSLSFVSECITCAKRLAIIKFHKPYLDSIQNSSSMLKMAFKQFDRSYEGSGLSWSHKCS